MPFRKGTTIRLETESLSNSLTFLSDVPVCFSLDVISIAHYELLKEFELGKLRCRVILHLYLQSFSLKE